jgi:dTMP kinase
LLSQKVAPLLPAADEGVMLKIEQDTAMALKGKLISIEGIDGCGKDTQLEKVYNYLRDKGIQVAVYTFPNYDSVLGNCIKHALSEIDFSPYAIQLLFSADRAQQFQSIQSDLLQSKTVLTSRSKWSSYVYASKWGSVLVS